MFFEALCQFLVGLSDSAGGRTQRSSNRAFTVPPLPLERPRRQVQRFTLSHDQRRVAAHYFGYVDPARLAYAQLSIGAACGQWSGVLANPFAILHSMFWPPARILKFPAKAGKKRDGCCGI